MEQVSINQAGKNTINRKSSMCGCAYIFVSHPATHKLQGDLKGSEVRFKLPTDPKLSVSSSFINSGQLRPWLDPNRMSLPPQKLFSDAGLFVEL